MEYKQSLEGIMKLVKNNICGTRAMEEYIQFERDYYNNNQKLYEDMYNQNRVKEYDFKKYLTWIDHVDKYIEETHNGKLRTNIDKVK